jgi:hypothetical protein
MNRVTFFGGPLPFLSIVAAAVITVALSPAQPARAASTGDCVTAIVDTPFRLPDGRLYPAGPLTLCDSGIFSPVDNLHQISVGGTAIGLFRSRRRNAETSSMLAPEVVFNRDVEGHLELIGYAVPSSGHAVAYRLRGTSDTWQASAPRRLGGTSAAPIAAIVVASGTR